MQDGNGRCRKQYWWLKSKAVEKRLLEGGEREEDQLFQVFRTWFGYDE